ncbi:MAG: glycosyltransferase [Chloroflexota bacterium]
MRQATSDGPPYAATEATVVIPAYNAATTLGACLDALAAQGIPGTRAHLIVVDDASTDATSAIARRPGVNVLRGPGTGPAAARNAGIRVATTEVVVFLDADTVPATDWLEQMLAPFARPDVIGVKGRYRTVQRNHLARFTQLEFEWKYERLQRATRRDYMDTGTAAFRRSALLGIGGFDESLRASEDVDLAFRLSRNSGAFVYNPHAIVTHHHTEEMWEYFLKKVRAAYTRAQVYERHPDKALGDSYTPPMMGVQIALAGVVATLVVCRLAGVRRAPWGWALTGFALTSLPVQRQALRRDPEIAVVVPLLTFVRAFAQGLGVAGSLTSRVALILRKRR